MESSYEQKRREKKKKSYDGPSSRSIADGENHQKVTIQHSALATTSQLSKDVIRQPAGPLVAYHSLQRRLATSLNCPGHRSVLSFSCDPAASGRLRCRQPLLARLAGFVHSLFTVSSELPVFCTSSYRTASTLCCCPALTSALLLPRASAVSASRPLISTLLYCSVRGIVCFMDWVAGSWVWGTGIGVMGGVGEKRGGRYCHGKCGVQCVITTHITPVISLLQCPSRQLPRSLRRSLSSSPLPSLVGGKNSLSLSVSLSPMPCRLNWKSKPKIYASSSGSCVMTSSTFKIMRTT